MSFWKRLDPHIAISGKMNLKRSIILKDCINNIVTYLENILHLPFDNPNVAFIHFCDDKYNPERQ